MKNILNYSPGGSFGIGKLGEHLTITTLSLQKSELTIRLLKSFQSQIPLFRGKFLILDNGSDKKHIDNIKRYIDKSKQNIELIEAKTNLGTFGGKNYCIEFIKTEWTMFLDNDVYIDSNFLPDLHLEINRLGAHFISIPLKKPTKALEEKLKKNFSSISNQNLQDQLLNNAMQDSFILSRNCILNIETFKKTGKFDQNFFDGTGEIDFSIKIWKQGFKVVCSSTSCFITSNNYAEEQNDKINTNFILNKYNKKNYYLDFLSNEQLDFHNYLNKLEYLNDNKINIAIITDVIDWAFSNIAFNLTNIKQDKFNFMVIPYSDSQTFNDNCLRMILTLSNCQIIHFMWRGYAFNFKNNIEHYSKHLDSNYILKNYSSNKVISTCIYDHILLPNKSFSTRKSFKQIIKQNYYVSSKKLFEIYSQIKGIASPLAICQDGVDLRLFYPKNSAKFSNKYLNNQIITLGWAGNSRFGNNDHKGLHNIINPAINRLKSAGYLFKFEIADRNIIWRTQNDMPEFYNNIDILICASINEGTPNTVLEAMACGCAIVTTDVGIVREALGPHQQGFIAQRTVDDFFYKLKLLLDNKFLLSTLRLENLDYIKYWDWSIKGLELIEYFNKVADINNIHSSKIIEKPMCHQKKLQESMIF